MNLSEKGLDLIKSFETLRLTAYAATEDERKRGIWSLGYGHTKEVKEFNTCSIQQANEWLLEDCAEAINCVNNYVTSGINQNQFDALISLVFNIGTGNFKESTLLKKLNEGAFSESAEQFLRWDHQNGKVLPGLTRRRESEKVLFETPYDKTT